MKAMKEQSSIIRSRQGSKVGMQHVQWHEALLQGS